MEQKPLYGRLWPVLGSKCRCRQNGPKAEPPWKPEYQTPYLSVLSPGIPHELLGASNKPVSWDEAMRLMRLGPQCPSHAGHVKRRLKALDAQPHPNGSG